jgi:hypothetical protein
MGQNLTHQGINAGQQLQQNMNSNIYPINNMNSNIQMNNISSMPISN